MNKSELAKLMLEYEEIKRKCDAIEKEITDAVMYLEESVEVGNVRATLRAGRKTYDYQAATNGNPLITTELINRNSELKIDWKSICEEANIKDIPFEVGNPSVSIKIFDA
jgi:hypothetical protein